MKRFHVFSVMVLLCMTVSLRSGAVNERSIYTERPQDPEAFYFTPDRFGFKADGKSDVSEALQEAINQLKREKNFGILFIPEGKYRISRTIYIPGAIRLIGYGKNRPEFILSKNSPGFQEDVPGDKGRSKYMFWFTGGIVADENRIGDAGAGTFYSAMSNINLRIEDGNPTAVALRTHYAQHSFVSYMSIHVGKGRAGLFDIGNEMENLAFYGGDYGIMTTKASPGWQVMMVDALFDGQRKAAIRAQESGLAIVNLQVRNVPTVFEVEDNYWEKLYIENGRFEHVSGPAIRVAVENNSSTSVSLRDIVCNDVPVLVSWPRTGEKTAVPHKMYRVRSFDHGLQMESMTDTPSYKTLCSLEPISSMPAVLENDLPQLPPMSEWKSVRDFGAKGDGVADDTEAIQAAVDACETVYFPTGWYRVSQTLKLRPGSRLIGLHPFATQLRLAESTPAFSGFGSPKAMVESSEGGNDILNGIGINTGAYNYRAVGVKWMAGAASYVNDVKFVGGHGTMRKPEPTAQEPRRDGPPENRGRRVSSPENPIRDAGFDQAWDKQYWSFWVTNGGGGTFKDIWTASTYSANGFYAENTDTPSRIYAMSIEHHVRNEVRFNRVANWKIFCMQTEEESVESIECQPLELDDCHDLTFANLYMFRVIRVNRPWHSSVRIRGCRNIEFLNVHNYSQIKYTTDIAVFDQNKNLEIRPWEFSRLIVTGDEQPATGFRNKDLSLLANDFEFTEGMAVDSKGNVYFCDNRKSRVWRWSPEKGLRLVADFPWKPYNIAFDSEDNMLVTFRYDRQPGFDEDPMDIPTPPDSKGTSFAGWGNSGYFVPVYTMDPENPEETLELLPLRKMGSVPQVYKALYPANRWRDFHDFNEVAVYRPEWCFVAPDGKTIIPQVYDLARSAALAEAFPGRPFYASNEYDRRIVRMDVAEDGGLSNLTYFVEDGEFSVVTDAAGNVWLTDGEVQAYGPDGKHLRTIRVPERPSTLAISGNTLYIATRSSLYGIEL